MLTSFGKKQMRQNDIGVTQVTGRIIRRRRLRENLHMDLVFHSLGVPSTHKLSNVYKASNYPAGDIML